MEGGFFEIKLKKSPISVPRRDREVLRGMGLPRFGRVRFMKDTPQLRGMIFRMSHVLEVKRFKTEAEYKKYRNTLLEDAELPVIVEGAKRAAQKKKPPTEERVSPAPRAKKQVKTPAGRQLSLSLIHI